MKKLVLVVVLTMSSAELAWAQALQNVVLRNSFNPLGAGARGLGMGGAFIAVADDGTAASFNPAGLAQLRRSELAAVGFSDKLESTIVVPRAEGSTTTSSTSEHGAPDFVGLAVPFEIGSRHLTVQISYQRAVDLFGKGKATILETRDLRELDPDLRGVGEFIADIEPEQSGAFHTASLAAGYQVTSRLSLGLAANVWVGEWTARGKSDYRVRVRVPGQTRPIEVPIFDVDFDQKQSLRGLNLNTGFLLRYPRISIGGVLRLPFAGDYNLVESDVQKFFGDEDNPREVFVSMNSRLHWPRSAGVGLALRPFRGLTLAADYTRAHWSRASIEDVQDGALLTDEAFDAKDEPIDTFVDRNFFDLFPSPQTSTTDTSQWRAGGEYLVVLPKIVIPLRGGLFRDRSPVAEFGTSEGKKIRGVTFGTGINFSRVVLDVAFERRESEGLVGLRFQQGEVVPRKNSPIETVKEDRFVASLIFRFGADDPMKRLLRYLFVGSQAQENN